MEWLVNDISFALEAFRDISHEENRAVTSSTHLHTLKKLAYMALIYPKTKYASAIWDPDQASVIDNIESLQNRAVCFIFSDYSRFTSVTALKQRAKLEPLSRRRQFARLALFHKLYHHSTLHDDFFSPPLAVFPRRDHAKEVKRITCHL